MGKLKRYDSRILLTSFGYYRCRSSSALLTVSLFILIALHTELLMLFRQTPAATIVATRDSSTDS